MKVCIIQPPYSKDTSYSDEFFDFKMQMLDNCAVQRIRTGNTDLCRTFERQTHGNRQPCDCVWM